MKDFLKNLPRFLFFTGKGGVGKTSLACATAVGLADLKKNVLIISTDPASNLDEILETKLGPLPTPLSKVPGLSAMNINPIEAAREYRERMVGPYRGVLPPAALQQMEEQLSGACTVEIAGFNEFAKYVGDASLIANFDHIVLDTAPTGHTLRLLNLSAAWKDFLGTNQTGSSCLGPVSGLIKYKALFESVLDALRDARQTLLILVSRSEEMSFREADRASGELRSLGLNNQRLIVNGFFGEESPDPIAHAFAKKSREAFERIPPTLASLSATRVGFRPRGVTSVASIRSLLSAAASEVQADGYEQFLQKRHLALSGIQTWEQFFRDLESRGHGVIMTMGKGGVGKTTMAATIAAELAERGHSVLLSTTDPAAHVSDVVGEGHRNLEVTRIDPRQETAAHVEGVLAKNRPVLSAEDLALLEEELRSPCIEEIAVFQAFARTVASGRNQFVVLDTAPTGHTLLLMDSTEAYHREVAKSAGTLSDEVKELLPRLRDPDFTRVLIVSLPEATPTHEAATLQVDLRRAGIEPFGWIINRAFALSETRDPMLCIKSIDELSFIEETVTRHAKRTVVSPWCPEALSEAKNLSQLLTKGTTV